MRIIHLIKIILIITIVFLFASCGTERFTIRSRDIEIQTQTMYGITLSVKFLNEDDLVERFGRVNNPFIAPLSALGFTRMMVFEALVENNSKNTADPVTIATVIMPLNKIEIQFGGKNKNPVNRFHLYEFWKNRIYKDDTYKKWNSSKINQLIKKTVLPNTVISKPQSDTPGLLVFMGRFPNYGTADVYIPIFTEDGKQLHNFRFVFRF
ncbi:hypothetical protein ES703_59418 [subsurface metagenome]